ncbi:MAG: hypothetical protein ABEJ08_05755 [Halobacteriaceae archaeon]
MMEKTERDDGLLVRREEADDVSRLVVDTGVGTGVEADAVEGTAILVNEAGSEPVQREFDLPDGDAEVFISNGVVTIEVSR